ncbi:hypothetical protein C8N24_0629 [Solirubrobacter pauli]|uniref:Nuclease-like protein n=1 Tax=Solirubrobacter pauli TaxID=166793 RepID=A0A660LCP4_9ACTN|nr:hypothetical protein [Solirubrobacter pauli]RKQ90814.1 hypothetical protein C8N24_0629 [Solirubrobacter pauli]
MSADLYLELLLVGILATAVALGAVTAVILVSRSARDRRVATSVPEVWPVHKPRAQLGSTARLAKLLDRSRRLAAAEAHVGREFELIQRSGWMVERNVVTGAHRVPFVVLGPGGLFAICATDGAWTMQDLAALAAAGGELRATLPDYRGPVTAVVCIAFDDAEPRSWHSPSVGGGWVVGVERLREWLHACRCEDGFSREDIASLHSAAGPHWQRHSILRLPPVQNVG